MEAVSGGMAGTGIRERKWALLIGAVIGLLVGLLVGLLIGRDASPVDEARPSEVSGAAGPTAVQDGVPVGYAQTEEGAVVAATNFARVMSGPVGSPESYREAMRTVAAPWWVSRADELATNAIQFVNERYGEDGTVVFVPVRYRVSAYSDVEAVVDLWGSALGSGSEVEGIEQSWIIATVELGWVEDDWKVVGQSSRAGPTPGVLETASEMTAETLHGFQEYEYGPRP